MKKLKRIESRRKTSERGHILILVLVLMLLGSLIITPFLSHLSTGARTGLEFERKTNEFYAADSGIQDGQWQIRFNHLSGTFVDYSPYDYISSWSYNLPEKVNTFTVNTTIQNSWIPKDMTPPLKSDAKRILMGDGSNPPKVIVTGTVSDISTFQIKLQYYPDVGDDLEIETIGVWLPAGYTYVDGSSSLEASPYHVTPAVEPWAGGQVVTWSCGSWPFVGDAFYDPFPGVDPANTPMVSTMTFRFTGPSQDLEAISWVDTNLDLTRGGTEFITYTWDADIKVYRITAVAGDTEIEAYFPKSELRELGSAIGGDYRAIGNSLMARSNSIIKYRDILLPETAATVNDIPTDAHVEIAYLYWSGWFEDASTGMPADTTAVFKIDGLSVYFDTGGNPQQSTISHEIIADPANLGDRVQIIDNTSHGSLHGYSYSCRKDVTALVREYSNCGNADYTVGSVDATYDASDEWAYAGWSLVIIYSSVDTVGHRLYLYDDFLYKDHDGTFLDFDRDGSEGGSIGGFIIPDPVVGEVNAARITAFVGEGDIWYPGDYLLFNGTTLWDGTTTNGNSASSPNNCWNGESVGMTAEGVDVDTFYITWSGGLLAPGDTSARIDIWTDMDIWNLAYIILSFRSESTTGRSISYLVR
jgi:hypothetical protein